MIMLTIFVSLFIVLFRMIVVVCVSVGMSIPQRSRKIENSLTSSLSTERPWLVHWPIDTAAGVYVISVLVGIVGTCVFVVTNV